ncbi:MAG TPA: DUF3857 and transglutaminase domain-containing protein [Opitutaceae bacterium]
MKRLIWWLAALGTGLHGATFPDWAAEAAARGGGWDPSASAVILANDVRVQFSATDRFTEHIRRTIAIRQEPGIRSAGLALYYSPDTDRVRSIRAWIRSADGNVTALNQSAFDDRVVNFNQYFWDRQRIRTFNRGDALRPGAVVAYEVEIERNPGFAETGHDFGGALPAWSLSFDVIPVPGSHLSWYSNHDTLPPPAVGSMPGELRWSVGPRRGRGANRPAGYQAISQRVAVRCDANAPLSWPEFSRTAFAIMEPQMEETPEIGQLAQSLAANRTDRWSRIRAVTEWVQTQIVYLAISIDRDNLAGYRPHLTREILRNRYGDCKDKATLLVEMLRAIGEDPRLVLLAAGAPRAVDEHWPGASFNHVIVAIPAAEIPSGWPAYRLQNRRFVLFDPTAPGIPLGVLPFEDENGWGLLLDEHAGGLGRMPQFSDASGEMIRRVDARLGAHRRLEVQVVQENSGIAGANYYEETRLQSAEQFQHGLEGFVSRHQTDARDFTVTRQWSAPDSKMGLKLAFSVAAYGQPVSPGMFLVSPAIMPLALELREWGANVLGTALLGPVSDHVILRVALPDGSTVEDIPDPWSESVAGSSASVAFQSEPHAFTCDVRFQRRAGDYNRRDYGALRQLCAHLDEHQHKPVLLDFPSHQ